MNYAIKAESQGHSQPPPADGMLNRNAEGGQMLRECDRPPNFKSRCYLKSVSLYHWTFVVYGRKIS